MIMGSTGGSTNAGLAENLKGRRCPGRSGRHLSGVARTLPDRGRRRSSGNLAPEGAIVNFAGIEQLQFEGWRFVPIARREALRAEQDRAYRASDVITIRYEGPKGGPDMRAMLSTTSAVYGTLFRRDAWFLRRPCPARGAAGRSRGCGMATAS